MASAANTQVRLASRPTGLPQAENWEVTEEPVPQPGPGQFLVRNLYLSLDPAMRGWMNEGRSYIEPVGLGEIMRAGGIGKVVSSSHPDYGEGDYVTGLLGAQEYAMLAGDAAQPVDPSVAPLPAYLGALGMPGMTAY